MSGTAMVIGYGNELRGDDGIGKRIANAINSWHLLTVKSLAVHQLTPELAANLANADLAIFVDACIHCEPLDVQVRSLSSRDSSTINGHTGDPRSLLALTESLYGHCPPAWLVTVPGVNFEISDRISPSAENGIAIALIKIIRILDKCRNLWM
ncbi:hydrogenase maturation protease [Anabaena cylindrica FACHB-243]|uniref:Hydrogenase maturation protease n=1 Tax=Anabaena cylindrica (strain ATCC 27899 / PCC 7122) TaxID=272123 RepID=K9ZM33_ANACC|nr:MULTISPECIES: hydrogenase maturation protease [Anabaena]AFZ59612.1 hydrogenase maturation protease [Anabaena cylindrica PCC 7122]MBD2418724.1 hydrogenase maturation protease [Anabaena cylindrica FACHB-243]MBY5281649.1 hydrogenase maturation protease [Anabaena sp. CCAP 1446/1C]MBY5309175.1 hydrogenase maturation protease [Anabaena sp. CCAP 1446/1C]MCM2406287.1 hydrogenase maturation protease [Anabaena sp. CCAP 1446/1C]